MIYDDAVFRVGISAFCRLNHFEMNEYDTVQAIQQGTSPVTICIRDLVGAPLFRGAEG